MTDPLLCFSFLCFSFKNFISSCRRRRNVLLDTSTKQTLSCKKKHFAFRYLLPVVIAVLPVPLQTFSCPLHVSFFVLRQPKNITVHYRLENVFLKFSCTCFVLAASSWTHRAIHKQLHFSSSRIAKTKTERNYNDVALNSRKPTT